MAGGLANGDRKSFGPFTGEQTDVASAKRVLRGAEPLDDILDSELVRTALAKVVGCLALASIVGKPALLDLSGPLTISMGDTGRN